MGLKKLFSTKEKEDKSNEHRRSMSRTSTLSHAISHFTHKDKHQSLDIKQPSPNSSTSFVSSPTTLTPTTKVTQNDEPVAHHQHALSRPITPSDSMRDVYDVLHVIQKTDSSEQDFLPSDATIPIATPDSKSQVHVPPPARFLTMDSNKFEVEDEDDDDSQHHGGVTDTPIEDDDSDSAAKGNTTIPLFFE